MRFKPRRCSRLRCLWLLRGQLCRITYRTRRGTPSSLVSAPTSAAGRLASGALTWRFARACATSRWRTGCVRRICGQDRSGGRSAGWAGSFWAVDLFPASPPRQGSGLGSLLKFALGGDSDTVGRLLGTNPAFLTPLGLSMGGARSIVVFPASLIAWTRLGTLRTRCP